VRFPKDTRAEILKAGPNSVTITWPKGQPQPVSGKVYWLQRSDQEIAEEEKNALEARRRKPPTHREVMAEMHLRAHGSYPPGYKLPEPPRAGRPRKGDARIKVQEAAILEDGWEATVILWEEPDPIQHLGVKTKVAAGFDPIIEQDRKVETEPEKITLPRSRRQREEEEEALRIEHKASVDHSEVVKAEQRLLDQRRKGKPGKLAAAAVVRARKRAALATAGGPA
jgi:hypothetical protein